jgi:2-polyprenyl-3-methyl-5-hydroxy-6-metoxy-1,4-benzoquinol methylase
MSQTEIQRLDEISSFYEQGDYMDNLLIDRCVELVLKTCQTRTNALEIGCGGGYSTKQLVNYFESFEVLEGSLKNIELTKNNMQSNITFHNTLLENFKTDRKYDNIIFLHVLEHVDNPIDCLKCLEALLTDEGQIYLAAPNCMSLNRRAGFKMGLLKSYDTLAPKDYLLGHRRLYTVDMMREHCTEAGLKVSLMKGVYLKPLAETQMIDLGDDVVRAFYALGEDIPEYCADIFAVAKKRYY